MKLIEMTKDRKMDKKPVFKATANKTEDVVVVSRYAVILTSFTILLITLMSIFYVGICAQNVKSQYNLSRLKEQRANLEKTKLALKLEVSRLNSLERIETIARKELGMAHPPNRLVIDMRNPSVLRASIEDVVAIDSYYDEELTSN
ncbi:cell division protein FtsL [bacterium]|nr:cell division protein FtsL [bacterium]